MEKIKDELFGDLTFDEQTKLYKTISEPAPGRKIEIFIDKDNLKIEDALPICRQIFRRLNLKNVRTITSEQLLELYNTNWSEGEIIKIDEFKGRIRLESIKLSPYGAEIYWDDNELFGGHTIIVTIDKQGNVKHSDIAG